MPPIIEGVIARRILLNFRVDPEVAQALTPAPLKVKLAKDNALFGICLLRIERARPKGLPEFLRLASENMAHRYAIRFAQRDGEEEGVFIPRRDTDDGFVQLLGGRAFPGYAHRARFRIQETAGGLEMEVHTDNAVADLHVQARWPATWQGSKVFDSFEDASNFFRQAPCGFNWGRGGRTLEGLRLQTKEWRMEPLQVSDLDSRFYENRTRFPQGSVEFDHGLLMRAIPHEWYALSDVPELAGEFGEPEPISY